jgi:hypothetical protein
LGRVANRAVGGVWTREEDCRPFIFFLFAYSLIWCLYSQSGQNPLLLPYFGFIQPATFLQNIAEQDHDHNLQPLSQGMMIHVNTLLWIHTASHIPAKHCRTGS